MRPISRGWVPHQELAGALAAITASVVGVIGNLSLWFGLHVLFGRISEADWGPLRLLLPDPASLNPLALGLTLLAALLIFGRHWGLPAVLAVCATLSAGVSIF